MSASLRLTAQVSSRYRIERRAWRLEFLAILLEPLEPPNPAEVHNLRRPVSRLAAAEPLRNRFPYQSVARLAALPGYLVEPFDQLIVEMDAEIHRLSLTG